MLHERRVPAAKPSWRVRDAVEFAALPVSAELLVAEPKSSVTAWGVATPVAAAKAMPRLAVAPADRAPAVSKVTLPVLPVRPVMLASVVVTTKSHWPGAVA